MGELNRWDGDQSFRGKHSRPSGKASHDRKQDRQARFMAALVTGASIDEACVAAGIKRSTYIKWREAQDAFRLRVDELRNDSFRVPVGERIAKNSPDYRGDFASFRKAYFGYDTYPHMRKIVSVLEHSQPGSITLVLCPPEAGKTMVLSDWMNFKLAYNPNYRITVVSEGMPHARKILRHVAARMSDPNKAPHYYTRFGPFKAGYSEMHGKPWSADFITVLGATHDERDYCVDEQTEILTRRGWRDHRQLGRGDDVMCVDTETGLASWQPLEAIHRFPAREREMVSIETAGHSSLTTTDHRWWVRHRSRDTGRDTMVWRTSETLSRPCAIPTRIAYSDAPTTPKYDDAFVELVAWYWTEGSIAKISNRNWRVEISQSHRVNPGYVDRIRAALQQTFGSPVRELRNGSGWGESVRAHRGMTLFSVWTDGARRFDEVAPNKVPTTEFLCSLTQAQLELFLETSIDADGWRTNGQIQLSQVDERRVRAFEIAALLAGHAPRTRYAADIGMWVCCLYRRGDGYVTPHVSRRRSVNRVHHDGMVWCPQTPTGTWVARRNGTIYVTGNSLEARGWRSAIAGTRTDLLIVDDIQSGRSLNQTDQMVETFRQDFLTRPGREGRTVIVGTRVGVGDFYERIVMEDIVDKVVEFAALDDEGNSYCPEMWPLEDLNRKRQIVGEDVWWRNYMQQPRKSGTQTFTDELLEPTKDISRVIGQKSDAADDIVIGVDPALTGPCGFAVFAYNATRFECLELWSKKDLASVENLVGHIERLAARYRPSTVVVEGNAFQRGLVHDERLAQLGRVYGFRVVQHTTHSNKLDESIGVARIPTSMIAGQVSFPYGDELARRQTDVALEEFRNWRPGIPGRRLRQDMVMATWFCWLHWRRWQDYSPRDVGLASVRALPWRPTANLLRAGT